MKLAIFYHCSLMGDWKEVDKQIMGRMKSSGLLEEADVFVKNKCKDLELYEFPTLEMLDQFCITHEDYYVMYIHTKGVSREEPSIADWRECMLYWNVERWKECVAKLNEGFDTVGVNIVDSPVRHYQGNFWWAKATHIKNLGNIIDVQFVAEEGMNDRHKAEFWLLSQKATAYCPYHHKINPYFEKNPRVNYEGKKF